MSPWEFRPEGLKVGAGQVRGRLRDLSLRFRVCSWARRSARVRAMVLTTGFNKELNMGIRLMSLTLRPDQTS